ncbi:MAG: zinc ribbon domain-containing protein [Methanobrevibacter sp.]|nr:zinc ribbon domain-containing protein [Methanobrevibacter sp.]
MDKCPNCGKEVKKSDIRCSHCGKELNKKSKVSSKLIIGIIAVIVIIAIAGAFASGVFNNNTQDQAVSDNANTESVAPQSDDSQSQSSSSDDSSSSASTEYWASAKAEKFHTPDCEWAQKISESNKIVYQSRDDAIADGKVPCGACNP